MRGKLSAKSTGKEIDWWGDGTQSLTGNQDDTKVFLITAMLLE